MLTEPPQTRAPFPMEGRASVVEVLRTTADSAAELVGPDFPSGLQTLTDAEYRVLRHLKVGLSNKEIASAVGRSEATVKNQIASMLHKLGVPTRARLIAMLWCAERYFDWDQSFDSPASASCSAEEPPSARPVSGHAASLRSARKISPHWRGFDCVLAP